MKTLKKINELELRFKSFLGKEADLDEIEIVKWDEEKEYCWTIASFEKCDEEYCLESCGERLEKDIDWATFGQLVELGYKYLHAIDIFDDVGLWEHILKI